MTSPLQVYKTTTTEHRVVLPNDGVVVWTRIESTTGKTTYKLSVIDDTNNTCASTFLDEEQRKALVALLMGNQ